MSKMIVGSICLDDLKNAAKNGHSAFQKSEKNGKLYVSLLVWEHDERDEFGQDFAIQLNSEKAKRDDGSEKKSVYIGNLKRLDKTGGDPGPLTVATEKDTSSVLDDLPF